MGKARRQEAVIMTEAASSWGSVLALFNHSLRTERASTKGMAHVKGIFEQSLRPQAHQSAEGMAHVKAIFERSLRPEVKERLEQESSSGMAHMKAIFERSLRPEVKERLEQELSRGMADVKAIFQGSLRSNVTKSGKPNSSESDFALARREDAYQGMADVKAIFDHALRPEASDQQPLAEGMPDVKAFIEHSPPPGFKERLSLDTSDGMGHVIEIFRSSQRCPPLYAALSSLS